MRDKKMAPKIKPKDRKFNLPIYVDAETLAAILAELKPRQFNGDRLREIFLKELPEMREKLKINGGK